MIEGCTSWPSPAKLNLFLYIIGQKKNGYHNLQTLLQFLDCKDKLIISANNSRTITLETDLSGIPPESNLVYRAGMALRSYTGCSFGAHIQIKKILPIGGGVGGGSSNAATTLVALNYLWRTRLEEDDLAKIGLTLGADVPIFIRGISALVEGIGEKITPAYPEEKWYLVVRPDVSISTADIFNYPYLKKDTPKKPIDRLLSQKYSNDCEETVRLIYPEVDSQISWLLQYAPSRLTGTGSCVFAEFSSAREAEEIRTLVPNGTFSFIARGVNTSPLKRALVRRRSLDLDRL